MTTASWIRSFVDAHPDYKHDSVVSEKVNFDLMKRMKDISEGVSPCAELTGTYLSKTPDRYMVLSCPVEPTEAQPNSETGQI